MFFTFLLMYNKTKEQRCQLLLKSCFKLFIGEEYANSVIIDKTKDINRKTPASVFFVYLTSLAMLKRQFKEFCGSVILRLEEKA